MVRATNTEVNQRVEEVLRLRLKFAQFHDVVQWASDHNWGVTERQLWNYIRKADELIAERSERSRRRLLARHIAQREALAARELDSAKPNLRTVLAIADSKAQLEGLLIDGKELKALAKIAADQAAEIEKLKKERANAAGVHPPSSAPEPEGPGEPAAGVDEADRG